MSGFSVEKMQEMQKALQNKYRDHWSPIGPATGREKLLYLFVEAGEIVDILKKEGDRAVMEQPETRAHFIEEICDTLMYLNDVMLCYDITPDELERVYLAKHNRNMTRW